MAAVSSICGLSSPGCPTAPLTMNRRYSALRGSPSSKTTMDATTLVPWTWLTSKHSIRNGALTRSSPSWSSCSATLRAARSGAHARVAHEAAGHPQVDLGAPQPREPRAHVHRIWRQDGDQHLSRDPLWRLAAVDLLQEVLDHRGQVFRVLGPTLDHPASLTSNPSAADVEHLDRSLELIVGKGKHVGVGRISQHHGRLLQRPGQGPDIVPHPGRLLVVERGSGGRHTGFETLDEPAGVAGHEVAEVLGDHPVLFGADPADTRSGALVDVAEQARPADLSGTCEDTTAAGAHREHAQQLVERLADRPRLGVGTEVSRPLALGSPHHLSAGELLTHGDGEVGVG